MIDRPMDYLNERKGERVLVRLRNIDKHISGILLAFDIHINIVIVNDDGEKEFIRGDNILSIS